MKKLSKLIAGVHIRMSSDDVAFRKIDLPAEQLFYVDNCEKPDMKIKILSGVFDYLKDAKILIKTSGLWNGYIKGDKFIIALRSAANNLSSMTVVTNKDATEADVYVSPDFFSSDSDVWVMNDPFHYPLDQVMIMNHLAYRSGVIIHSAGMSIDGAGIICAGISGAGKSTISRLIMESMPDIRLLCDDRTIARKTNGEYIAYGTPWHGDADIALNDSASLKAIFFLKKDQSNRINRLTAAQALRRLFPVVSCPWYDKERMPLVLATCESLLSEIPCFDFCFTPDQQAVMMLREFMSAHSYE